MWGDTTDIIAGADLINGVNVAWTTDRDGISNTAIHFDSGYYSVPSGIYFKGDLTISAWVKMNEYVNWQRLIDFGNGPAQDNVLFALPMYSYDAQFQIYAGQNQVAMETINMMVPVGQWFFFACKLTNNNGYIYINSTRSRPLTVSTPRNVMRYYNYIGKSHWSADGNTKADITELKIYDRSLSDQELLDEFNNYKSYVTKINI